MQAQVMDHVAPRSDRIELLDVLRGLSLCGVFFSNVHVWFSGRILLPPLQLKHVMSVPANAVIDVMERYFVGGKFITIFSFLFGVGLAMQFERTESETRFYLRRGSMMLLFGAIHLFGLWFGDILHVYALLGFVVLLFRGRSDRAIFVWGLVCTFLGPMLVKAATVLLAPMFTAPSDSASLNASMFAAFAHGSYVDVVRANAVGYWERFVNFPSLGFYLEFLGKVLLGYHAGRIRFFQRIDAERAILRKLIVAGLVAGVLGEVGAHMISAHAPSSTVLGVLSRGLRVMHSTGVAAFYASTIALLFQHPATKSVLALFAPMGRMAVTNYLTQSAVALMLFYGIGLGFIGRINTLTTLVFPISVFAAQVAMSQVWLRNFRMGPVEWVWRSVTYGRAQPMRMVK